MSREKFRNSWLWFRKRNDFCRIIKELSKRRLIEMKKNKVENYILVQQVHFGSIRTSVPKGTVVVVDRDSGEVRINGATHQNVNEVDICLRQGYLIPYVDGKTEVDTTVRLSPRARNLQRKYEVQESVEDCVVENIEPAKKKTAPISNKNGKMEVIREKNSKGLNGMDVVGNNPSAREFKEERSEKMQILDANDLKVVATIPEKPASENSGPKLSSGLSSDETASIINGMENDGRVVATIGEKKNSKVTTKSTSAGKKLVVKRGDKESAARAKANAEARKKALGVIK